jgi:hypothetical protein
MPQPAQARAALALYGRKDAELLARVSVSSDAYGSWPVFDARGELVSYEVRAQRGVRAGRVDDQVQQAVYRAGKVSQLEAGARGASAACRSAACWAGCCSRLFAKPLSLHLA